MSSILSESLVDAGVRSGGIGRKIDEKMKLMFRELVAAERSDIIANFSRIKLPPTPGRSGYEGMPGRPRLAEFLRYSFSRKVGFVYEIYGALYRKPQCLLHCWIEPEGFDTIDDGEITYTYSSSSSSVVPHYSTDHTERRLARLSLEEEAHHDYSKDHMERLARLALDAHNEYYSGEEEYMLVSLEKAVFKTSINEYYITFTASKTSDNDDVKTVQAIVVNYFGEFDFVLYVKINKKPAAIIRPS